MSFGRIVVEALDEGPLCTGDVGRVVERRLRGASLSPPPEQIRRLLLRAERRGHVVSRLRPDGRCLWSRTAAGEASLVRHGGSTANLALSPTVVWACLAAAAGEHGPPARPRTRFSSQQPTALRSGGASRWAVEALPGLSDRRRRIQLAEEACIEALGLNAGRVRAYR